MLTEYLWGMFVCTAHNCAESECPKTAELCLITSRRKAAADGVKQAAFLVEMANTKEGRNITKADVCK